MSRIPAQLTDQHVQAAMDAAMRRFGLTPEAVAGGARGSAKTRVLAAAACAEMGMATRAVAAAAFGISDAVMLAPSQRARRGVAPEDLSAVTQALEEAGLSPAPQPAPGRRVRSFAGGGRRGGPSARIGTDPQGAVIGPRRSPTKPVTARIVRWARFFLDGDWPLDETAALFDVHPDALVDALNPCPAAEAA